MRHQVSRRANPATSRRRAEDGRDAEAVDDGTKGTALYPVSGKARGVDTCPGNVRRVRQKSTIGVGKIRS